METSTQRSASGGVAGSNINQSTFVEALRESLTDPNVRKTLASKLNVSESKINIQPSGSGWDFSVEGNQGAPFRCHLTPSFGSNS